MLLQKYFLQARLHVNCAVNALLHFFSVSFILCQLPHDSFIQASIATAITG